MEIGERKLENVKASASPTSNPASSDSICYLERLSVALDTIYHSPQGMMKLSMQLITITQKVIAESTLVGLNEHDPATFVHLEELFSLSTSKAKKGSRSIGIS